MYTRYFYASAIDTKPIKQAFLALIEKAKDNVKDKIKFYYSFNGVEKYDLITSNEGINVGYDFDGVIKISPETFEKYEPDYIKIVLMDAFNALNEEEHIGKFQFIVNSRNCFTIRLKDPTNHKLIHTCDLYIVKDNNDKKEYIKYTIDDDSYSWEEADEEYLRINEKYHWIQDNGFYNFLRKVYLAKRSRNSDYNIRPSELRFMAMNEICKSRTDKKHHHSPFFDEFNAPILKK